MNNNITDEYQWPDGFMAEILTLLDLIEIEDDASLSYQRFDIAKKYGMTVKFREKISGAKH